MYALQLALLARGDGDLRFGNVKLLDQVLPQRLHVHALGRVLCLKQHDRPDVFVFLLCLGLEFPLCLHSVEHRCVPALRMFHQDDRQFDHVLGLQLLRGT